MTSDFDAFSARRCTCPPSSCGPPRAVDARSDIWSLGVVLYELLTAHAPFLSDGMPELIAAILHKAPRSIEDERPEVPAGLRAAVHRCLEKEPSMRFADTGELAKALAEFGPPWAGRCVERVSHVLDPGVAAAAGPRTRLAAFAKTLPAIAPSRPSIVAESVAGSSRTIRPWGPGSSTLVSGQPSSGRKALRPWLLGAIGVLAIGTVAGVVDLPRGEPKGDAQRPSPTSPTSGGGAELESPEPHEPAEPRVADKAPPTPAPSSTVLAPSDTPLPKRTPKTPKLASSGGDAPRAITAAPSASPLGDPLNRLKPM